MDEIRPGLWTWTGEHPEWTPEFTWGSEVRSYAVQIEDERYLIDPIQPAPRADGILLTVPWHRRAADELDIEVLDDPPVGIEARPGFFVEESVFWLPQHKAIVIGDAFQDGNVPPFELATEDPDAAYARLRALLDLPFELVCPTHGDITDRAAFEASVAA